VWLEQAHSDRLRADVALLIGSRHAAKRLLEYLATRYAQASEATSSEKALSQSRAQVELDVLKLGGDRGDVCNSATWLMARGRERHRRPAQRNSCASHRCSTEEVTLSLTTFVLRTSKLISGQ
jgi:hypothetical protein